MPTVPPALTAACYVAVLCLMVWKRSKAAWAWMIVASSVLGLLYLFCNEWLYSHWRIHWYQFDSRLYVSQMLQWWIELIAIGLLFFRTRWLKSAPDECCYAFAAALLHLILRLHYSVSYTPGWYPPMVLLQAGHVLNLIMISAIAVVVWNRRDCA